MDDLTQAAKTVAGLLQSFIAAGELRLRFRVTACPGKPDLQSGDARGGLFVEFTGPDTPMLIARNGDLLNALEHIAAKALRLEPEEHDRVSFDAGNFKADRDKRLRASAAAAILRVQATGHPFAFPSMTSRERRMLHLVLHDSGLPTASSGEGPGRFVVLYPEGADMSIPMEASLPRREPRDASGVRNAFRPRSRG
jgi:spoIIIJ-associated protein